MECMTDRPISLRAQVALADLAVILHGGTRDDVDRWTTTYSWSDSERDVGVLIALAGSTGSLGSGWRAPHLRGPTCCTS